MRTAVVIPTLDEEEALAVLLPTLDGVDEVWVSDGGSRDRTVEIARAHGVGVTEGPPGRGVQLHRAAVLCGADLLLFLHADTRIGSEGLDRARAAVENGAVGGGFRLRFEPDRPWLRWGAAWINLRTRLTGCPLGDQAQFVRRDVYDRLGGFRPWPVLEDLDFARRLRRAGRTVLLDPPVVTSARRFVRRGAARTVATNWAIWGLYFLGVPPRRLARLYGRVR